MAFLIFDSWFTPGCVEAVTPTALLLRAYTARG
jgi:hypothetical protein